MDETSELVVPNAANEEARAAPIVAKVASVIGALAAVEGLVAPARFENAISAADAIGRLLGAPGLTKVLVLRALLSPLSPRSAIAYLKPAASRLPAAERTEIMHALSPLICGNAKLIAGSVEKVLAQALDVSLPDHHFHGRAWGVLGSFADLISRSEAPLLTTAREFAEEFDEPELLPKITAAQQSGDQSALLHALGFAVDEVRQRIEAMSRAADAQAKALPVAEELDAAADRIETIARKRYGTIMRRATMLKRHVREELTTLAEDSAEEFEVDFRRLAESKGSMLSKVDTGDLNDRMAVKNLERRYQKLARRYQEQLELLDKEASEFYEEFIHVGDEVFRSMARHEFRSIMPQAGLELRIKAAIDRASTTTLALSTVGAAASGVAMHAGLMTTVSILGVAATPVGALVLGAIALAGIWKVFASPGERRRRDPRERARALEQRLREDILSGAPRFDWAADAIVHRFGSAAGSEVAGPRVEADRIREIAAAYRAIADATAESVNIRIQRVIRISEAA